MHRALADVIILKELGFFALKECVVVNIGPAVSKVFDVEAVVPSLCSNGWARVMVVDSLLNQKAWVTDNVDVNAWRKSGLTGNNCRLFCYSYQEDCSIGSMPGLGGGCRGM
jgi:hypothetical protein